MRAPTHPPTTIRSATPADAPLLAPLLGELGYPSATEQLSGRLRRLLEVRIADPPDHVFVATAEGDARAVGMLAIHRFAALHADAPVALITALIVASSARGQGVGRRLVDRATEAVRAWGCERMLVTTHVRRADAHAFYERLGFEFTGRRYVKHL